MKIRDSVRISKVATVASSGTGTIATDQVKAGQALVAQSIAFKNATGARGTITLQIRNGSVVYPLGDQEFPSADTWYFYPYEVHLVPGEVIEASQASCSSSDKLHLMVLGYLEFLKEI